MVRVTAQLQDLHNAPKDLIWSLNDLADKERGRRFLIAASRHLPIYSAGVRQLYSKYDVAFASSMAIILPDKFAFTDTFSHVDAEAIRPIGMQLAPRPNGLQVIIPVRNRAAPLMAPMAVGFAMVRKQLNGRPLIPVIQKGDLKQYDQKSPALALHAIDFNKMQSLSKFEREDIRRALEGKLRKFEQEAESIIV